MRVYIVSSLLLLFISCSNNNTPQEEIKVVKNIHNQSDLDLDSMTLKGINDAINDIKNESSKYYDCNIHIHNQELIALIAKDYNIEIINSDCTISNYELGYNHIIDSVLLRYYGINMHDIALE